MRAAVRVCDMSQVCEAVCVSVRWEVVDAGVPVSDAQGVNVFDLLLEDVGAVGVGVAEFEAERETSWVTVFACDKEAVAAEGVALLDSEGVTIWVSVLLGILVPLLVEESNRVEMVVRELNEEVSNEVTVSAELTDVWGDWESVWVADGELL